MPFVSPCRALLRALFVPALIILFALASASAVTAAAGPKPAPDTPAAKPHKADRDGNNLFEDLEAELADLGAGDRLGVIVRLNVDPTSARLDSLKRGHGAFDVKRRLALVDGFSAQLTKRQIETLARVPFVLHIERNSIIHATNDSAQSSFGVTQARTDAPGLDGNADGNAAAYSKDDLVAAVIDTGIDAGHVDLDEGKVIAFKDFVNGRTAPYDDEGHGTHVAATIAGDGDARADRLHKGVAPDAALVGVKVLDATGNGTMDNVAAALEWVVQNKDAYGIEVVNLSLGASGCSDGTDITSQAVNKAHAAGLVVAVAAGNEGAGTCTIGTPGAAADALTVGAMADIGAGGFAQAAFSSRGKTADGRIKPDVSAPGVNITSAQANTTSGYVQQNGTSMATPFVAGVALLMKDASPALTPQDVKSKILATAIDWGRGGDNKVAGSRGPDVDYGAGRLDAFAALASAGATLGTAPAAPGHVLYEGTLSGGGASVSHTLGVTSTAFPIAATLIIPSIAGATASSPDFDLYLYGPTGALLASSERITRQENVAFQPTVTGTYTLRVLSYAGSGAYFVDASAGVGTAPAPTPVVDTTPPTITSVTPVDGAPGVAANANVLVGFSETMDAVATQGAFSLARPDGTGVAGAFSWSGNGMTFNPGADLAPGTRYTARVSVAAKDKAGNPLAAERMWSFTTVAAPVTRTATPGSVAISTGSLRGGDATRLGADDNAYYEVSSTTSGTRVSDWYGVIGGVPNALRSLKVTFAGKSSASCDRRLYAYNWTTGAWVQLDRRTLGTSETTYTYTVSGTLANHVSGTTGDGDVAIRVRCTRDSGSFYTSGDLLQIAYDA